MSNKYNNIVVPIAPRHESTWRTALPLAIDMALQHQATLHLVTVVPYADIPAIAVHLPKDIDRQLLNKGREILESLAKDQIPETVTVNVAVSQGRIDKQILHIAEEVNADLIVMASHRPKAVDYLISANAAYVTRHAKCSVMVVRDNERGERNERGTNK